MSRLRPSLTVLVPTLAALVAATAAPAAEPAGPAPTIDPQTYQRAVDRATQFLQTSQAPDGSFAKYAGPGVTSLVTTALLRNARGMNDPVVARALRYLDGMVHPDGGIYQPGAIYANYETCLAILCFKEANRDGRYNKVLKAADAYVKGKQWDEGEGIDRSNVSYGGAGYGKKERPDLSNTQFLVEALRAAGNGPDDANVQKALVFVSRCQNF